MCVFAGRGLHQRNVTNAKSQSSVIARRNRNKKVAHAVAVEANRAAVVTVVAAAASAAENGRLQGHEKVLSEADMIELEGKYEVNALMCFFC